jgi:beta-xylosidase
MGARMHPRRRDRCSRHDARRHWGRWAAGAVLVPIVLAAMPTVASSIPTPARPPAIPPATKPVAAQSTPLDPVTLPDPAVIVTPGQDLPNPFIIKVAHRYYLFSSKPNINGPNISVKSSTSLTTWPQASTDALPDLPPWAQTGFSWSPDVRKVGNHFVMWFSAWLKGSGQAFTKCIGVATSKKVEGPYHPLVFPSICQLDHLGSIDPRTMVDAKGHLWLVWKSDDNADLTGDEHSLLWSQRLARNDVHLLGQPKVIMTADQSWEGRIVEAPDMVDISGHYWLFFSGNWFNQGYYAIGVARCATPSGPCTPTAAGPWLASNAQGSGPGEESVFTDGRRWWMIYAPWAVDYQTPTPRPVALVRLTFDGVGPSVVAPETVAWSAEPAKPKPDCTVRPTAAGCPNPWHVVLAGFP